MDNGLRGKMKIVRAKKEDREGIKALIRLFPRKLMQKHLPTYRSFFVVKNRGKVVGCCALQVYSKRLAEIRSLAVHPDYQDNGIGPALVYRCVERAKELGIFEVLAIARDKSLFEAAGFGTFHKERNALLRVLGEEQSVGEMK